MPFVVLSNFATPSKQIETSSDAVTWASVASATDPSGGFGLAYGNGRFVALCFAADGTTSIAVVSTDNGATWVQHTVPQPNVEYQSLTYSTLLGVFVGIDSGDSTAAIVITSPDGVTWTQTAAIPQGADTQFYECITSGGPAVLVAVGDDSASHKVVATSPDGTNWTVRLGAGTKDWNGVCFGSGQYVAVAGTSADHQVMTSPDGITWSLQVTPTPRQIWTAVTFGNGLYVAVGVSTGPPSRPKIMTSPDGITWTMQVAPVVTLSLRGVVFGAGVFVAVGHGSAGLNVLTSPDGVTWTQQTSAIVDNLQQIAFAAAAPPVVVTPTPPSFTSGGGPYVIPKKCLCDVNDLAFEALGLAQARKGRWPYPWSYAPPSAVRVTAGAGSDGTLAMPASGQVLQYTVDQGCRFALGKIVVAYLGGALSPGDFTWSLTLNQPPGVSTFQGNTVQGFSQVDSPLGTLQIPWPLEDAELFEPNDTIRVVVTNVNLAGGFIKAMLLGWRWAVA